ARRGRLRRLLAGAAVAAALALGAPGSAREEIAAILTADELSYDIRAARITASGNVEIWRDGVRLIARRISYDRKADRLRIEGPIVLTEADGRVIVLARAAELDGRLEEGFLDEVRLVLDRRLQLAAARMTRQGGRYTALERVVTSACRVCRGGAPLWEIRARRVVHDQEERRLRFTDAQLRVGGVPVFWLPRLSLPDPTVRRASGWLAPELRGNSRIGTGLLWPYYRVLGRSADLTLTPFVSAQGATALDVEYRRVFARGDLQLRAGLASDRTSPSLRAWAAGDAGWRLSPYTRLEGRLRLTSDPMLMSDYGWSEETELENAIGLYHRRGPTLATARLSLWRDISVGADNDLLPSLIARAGWRRALAWPGLGLDGEAAIEAAGYRRSSSLATLGRDAVRVDARLRLGGGGALPGGLAWRLDALGDAAAFAVSDDPTVPASTTRAVPLFSARLGWPWLIEPAREAAGPRYLLSPMVQLVAAPAGLATTANEDSTFAEIDPSNLFALDRFAGIDGIEAGTRVNLGLGLTRLGADGGRLEFGLGRIYRLSGSGQFSAASGLGGTASDWLLWSDWSAPGRARLVSVLAAGSGGVSRAETRLDLTRGRWTLGGHHLFKRADALAGTTADRNELGFDASFGLGRHWVGRLALAHDFTGAVTGEARLGIGYRSECLLVDLTLSHGYTSAAVGTRDTTVSLRVQLAGFGSDGEDLPTRQCSR
ncbi:MAG: LPS-assembly protein LptD, partial [Alphaproteobacteria bacterium]